MKTAAGNDEKVPGIKGRLSEVEEKDEYKMLFFVEDILYMEISQYIQQ